jgi:hypothetical protein
VRQLGREVEAALALVAVDEFDEPGLEDRHDALSKRSDPVRILVDAGDVMAKIGKAGPRYEAHIAGADHGNSHSPPSPNLQNIETPLIWPAPASHSKWQALARSTRFMPLKLPYLMSIRCRLWNPRRTQACPAEI